MKMQFATGAKKNKRKHPRLDRVSANLPFKADNVKLDVVPYLKEIGETANRRMEQLMEELLKKNPAPDKETQQLA
ncbi:MAG: hypothetical protein ACI4PM_05870 [Butyricicoccus sp.]